tara:strand:+ start:16964 stop:18079 length:1116 start_codon:yes stop_codon:yes gene_type:complete
MKILILSDANSVHTLKWVNGLKKHNFKLMLFSLFKPNKVYKKFYSDLGVIVTSPNLRYKINDLREPNLSKIIYLKGFAPLKSAINKFKPDILHAHYASSYGVLALLSRFKPFILSVWGSDVLDFPYKNIFNRFLIKKIISNANSVCSTSNAMIRILKKEYNTSGVHLVPFGVDIKQFFPRQNQQKSFIVGTIKSIEKHNGIDCLIDAANIIVNQKNNNEIKFLIVGKGSLLEEMKQKVVNLNLQKYINFKGHVSMEKIAHYHKKLSLFIAVSTRESFGVAVLEAAACGVPSITSDVGGLPEVNKHGHTGLIIKQNDSKKLASAIIQLFEKENYRKKLGVNARNYVEKKFNWNKSVDKMIKIYKDEYETNKK